MHLLLIDGSNLIMRAAFGGDIPPRQAAPTAAGLIERAVRQAQATHLIIALDAPGPTWRHELYPDYKANRTRDTTPWLQAGYDEFSRRDWLVIAPVGFEADDVIATLAHRIAGGASVPASHPPGLTICSSDSDLLCLTALPGVNILRPVNGGKFEALTAAAVAEKYQIAQPGLLPEYKALTGESGDHIPGVPGIGPVRAAKLLAAYGSLDQIITAGQEKKCPASLTVATHEATARRALQLVTLRPDAPVPAIKPSQCALPQSPSAAPSYEP